MTDSEGDRDRSVEGMVLHTGGGELAQEGDRRRRRRRSLASLTRRTADGRSAPRATFGVFDGPRVVSLSRVTCLAVSCGESSGVRAQQCGLSRRRSRSAD